MMLWRAELVSFMASHKATCSNSSFSLCLSQAQPGHAGHLNRLRHDSSSLCDRQCKVSFHKLV